MSSKEPIFAPRDIFEQTLEYFPVATFDLVIEVPDEGILMVRRKIAPYAGKWALPGLRMYKNESIDDTLTRIARDEVGLKIDVDEKQLVGQFERRFKTEHDRQDLSTGYAVTALPGEPKLNEAHFTGRRYVRDLDEIPSGTGAMYRHHLYQYFKD